jgi:uncharacterized membrane protein
MIRSVLIGIVAGMRSLTPVAVISWAAQRSSQFKNSHWPGLLSHPQVSKVAFALAAAELLGDKMRSAPDRIITPGILARIATGAIAGMAVAPPREQRKAAVLGATAAVGAAYVSFGIRQRAIRKRGQTSTGLIEDALAIGAALLIVHSGTQSLHARIPSDPTMWYSRASKSNTLKLGLRNAVRKSNEGVGPTINTNKTLADHGVK